MKRIIIVISVFFVSFSSLAQQGINYKAIVKDSNGDLVANQTIGVRFTIEKSNGSGIYTETHSPTTYANGLIIVNIGEGNNPSSDFSAIDWSSDNYQLQTEIDLTGSYVEVGSAVPFKAIPYAKQADRAVLATNALFADEALVAQNVTGLEQITEESATPGIFNTGWRLIGRDPLNHGPIGDGAIDFSSSSNSSSVIGATGQKSMAIGPATVASGTNSIAMGFATDATGPNSTAMGYLSEASNSQSTAIGWGPIASGVTAIALGRDTRAQGFSSTAMGRDTQALGNYSTAMGYGTTARVYALTTIGSFNVPSCIEFCDTSSWIATTPIFIIGNGSSDSDRSNALVVRKNGQITAPSLAISEINSTKSLITKEYADSNYASNNNYLIDGGNTVSNNVGIGRSNPSSLFEVAHSDGTPDSGSQTNAFSIRHKTLNQSWQMYASGGGSLYIYEDGNFRGVFDEATGSYTQTSDRKAKTNIVPLEKRTLDKVLQLNPVSYLMKDQKDNKRHMGLISQEVQEIFPSVTHYVKEHDLLALSYTELVPILIKALQEQQEIIENQNIQLGVQNSKIEQFETSINNLMQRMERMEASNN